jgi:hypothetical protein
MRSAAVVIHGEMPASPMRVKVNNVPISVVVRPTCAWYRASTTDKNP